ncbi:hypothetical protein N9K77_00410 [bacterium]|nr:hypothetical protein [bacterium]
MKNISGISFNIHKEIIDDYVIKKIEIKDGEAKVVQQSLKKEYLFPLLEMEEKLV